MSANLANLDELVLACRDDNSRAFIADAVNCYNASAYRAAISSTWVAITYDIINKLRELELTGNSLARQHLAQFETYRAQHNVQGSLRFESTLLDVAKNDFEFLSPVEYGDLKRLYEDRSKCVHPSMQSLDQPFVASAELARLHIRNAVVILLSQPPVQGKNAIDAIWSAIDSQYFSRNLETAIQALRSTPIVRARQSVTRQIIIRLSVHLIEGQEDYALDSRYSTALNAILEIQRVHAESIVQQDVIALIRRQPDEKLIRVVKFISNNDLFWLSLPNDLAEKIKLFVSQAEEPDFSSIAITALQIDGLTSSVTARLRTVSNAILTSIASFYPLSPVTDELVGKFALSNNFATARELARNGIQRYPDMFEMHQVKQLLRAYIDNRQINEAIGMKSVYVALLDSQSGLNDMLSNELEEMSDFVATQNAKHESGFDGLIEAIESAINRPKATIPAWMDDVPF